MVDLRVLSDDPVAEQEAATLAALRARRPLVIGALLPRDWASHRSGRPSALLLAPDGSGYWPVQIKFHNVMETRPVEDATLRYSRLGDPRTVHERPGRSFRWGQRVKAALQLAHYWRLLEAAGLASVPILTGDEWDRHPDWRVLDEVDRVTETLQRVVPVQGKHGHVQSPVWMGNRSLAAPVRSLSRLELRCHDHG